MVADIISFNIKRGKDGLVVGFIQILRRASLLRSPLKYIMCGNVTLYIMWQKKTPGGIYNFHSLDGIYNILLTYKRWRCQSGAYTGFYSGGGG